MKFSYKPYLKAIDIAYPKIIEMLRAGAEDAIEKLSVINFDSTEALPPKVEMVPFLIAIHNELMLFKSEDLLSKLKKCGLKNIQLKWFVSLDEIEEQFRSIEAKGIIIDKPYALIYIRTHLHFKFSMQILSWATRHVTSDDVSKNILTDYLSRIKKRRKYSGGNLRTYKDYPEVIIDNLINEYTIETKGKFNIDSFLAFSKGKTEKTYLKDLIESCFDFDRKTMKNVEFLCTVYGLFKIILQDHHLAEDEADFDDNIDGYRNSFDIYRERRLKNILKLDMKSI